MFNYSPVDFGFLFGLSFFSTVLPSLTIKVSRRRSGFESTDVAHRLPLKRSWVASLSPVEMLSPLDWSPSAIHAEAALKAPAASTTGWFAELAGRKKKKKPFVSRICRSG